MAALLLLLVLALLGWAFLPHEPSYQGKSLSVWLRQFEEARFNTANSRYHLNAAEFQVQFVEPTQSVVRHMGTNALPVLLSMIQAPDSSLQQKKQRAAAWLGRFHVNAFRWVPAPQSLRQKMAFNGFVALGSNASPAVPNLVRLLDDNNAEIRNCAALCLGVIGPAAKEAVPSLLQHLNDPGVQDTCESSLGLIKSRPELVVPALTERLAGKNKWITLSALGWFGPDAKAAVPAVLPLLTNEDQETRTWAALALKRIDPEVAAKAGVE